MSLIRSLLMGVLVALCGCGPSPEEFARQCQKIAGIEVQDPRQWREYLRERKDELAKGKVTVDGNEIDPTDLYPVVATKSFDWTNDWVRQGRPDRPLRKPYRNDLSWSERARVVPWLGLEV